MAIGKGEPAFWLKWWFLLLCVLACLSAILAVYSYRLRQTTRQLHLRFEERLAERTRVAQELHDTLLQGVISASMQLHVAVDRLPDDLPTKPSLPRVLQVMSQVLEEGRDALQRLRASANSNTLDFEQAFSQIQLEFADHRQADFQIRVKGHPRPLHPLIRDEIYRIGREPIINAFSHSEAKNIEVEVKYATHELRVLVRDNGCGIDAQVLRSGRDGHFGLSGMRERAEKIGAKLKVLSRPGSGTEVDFFISGKMAFRTPASGEKRRLFMSLYPRRVETDGETRRREKRQ